MFSCAKFAKEILKNIIQEKKNQNGSTSIILLDCVLNINIRSYPCIAGQW